MHVAEQRDGMLPRGLLYQLRQRANFRDLVEEMARSKVRRTLVDIAAQCFHGRRCYYESRVLLFRGTEAGDGVPDSSPFRRPSPVR
jgi:hypothetical protein